MAARVPMMAANWKMNKTAAEAEDYMKELLPRVKNAGDVDVAVFAPFTCLKEVVKQAQSSRILAGAQNFYYEDSGAFTGEVSAPMLQDAGAKAVIVGHSERREIFCETDELVARKAVRAIAAGLLPIVCVGETKQERDAGKMWDKVSGQVSKVLKALEELSGNELLFAYEPIWAIGTGDTASPQDAQDAIGRIRALISELKGGETAMRIRILYGGSMKPDNVREIMAQPDVDGGLVGGASLDADSFAALIEAAR